MRAKEEEASVGAPTTKVCADCTMEIPIAAAKCPYCGNTHI